MRSFGTRDRGCSRHPAFPAPSFPRGGKRICKTQVNSSRENEHVCLHVIASEAKQSTYPLAALWIASSQALLAMTAAGDRWRGMTTFGGYGSRPARDDGE